MPKPHPTEQELAAREQRALEWRAFRKNFLFTQVRLAEVLEISRRTVQKIENCRLTPLANIQRRFFELRAEYRRKYPSGKAA